MYLVDTLFPTTIYFDSYKYKSLKIAVTLAKCSFVTSLFLNIKKKHFYITLITTSYKIYFSYLK